MPGTWPTSARSRSSPPSICPSIDPSSMPSFTSSRPSPPTRSTRSSQSATFSPAIVSKPQPENPLSGLNNKNLVSCPGYRPNRRFPRTIEPMPELESKDIQALVWGGEIVALTLDTNIFDQFQCNLDNKSLAALGQFKGTKIKVLLSPII